MWKQCKVSEHRNYLKQMRGKNVDFPTIEITSIKVSRDDVEISISKITPKKVRGNDVDILTSKITWKKYVEMTWKFVKIWSTTYQQNIHVDPM